MSLQIPQMEQFNDITSHNIGDVRTYTYIQCIPAQYVAKSTTSAPSLTPFHVFAPMEPYPPLRTYHLSIYHPFPATA